MTEDTKKDKDLNILGILKIGKYTIKPLSFGKLSLISQDLIPIIDKVIEICNALGINESIPSMADLNKIFLMILPDLPTIISKIIDEDEEVLKEMPANEFLDIVFAVWNMNKELITNFFLIGEMAGNSQI